MAFRSEKKLKRYLGVRKNSLTEVFHTMLRAGNESDCIISEDKTQMWHKSTPENKYNIIMSSWNTNKLDRFNTVLHAGYITVGYDKAQAHHDPRLSAS
jgi:hypothetical protein